jgi:surface protein
MSDLMESQKDFCIDSDGRKQNSTLVKSSSRNETIINPLFTPPASNIMTFRFTVQAALSSAVVSSAAASSTADANKVEESEVVQLLLHSKFRKRPARDSFVPQKLAAAYAAEDEDEEEEWIHAMIDQGNANANRPQLMAEEETVNNLSEAEATEAMGDNFDASQELGILNNAPTKRGRVLMDSCDDNFPVVDPILSFQGIVKRCLYYKDNCPFNASLPMNCWDTSQVTDMSYAFYNLEDFNEPIDAWDTSAVTDMSDMFGFCRSFDQPLDSWKVSSVTDMSDMFWGAKKFNHPINSWDISAVLNTDYMFMDARAFDQPLDEWQTSSVTDMKYMFAFAESFNQNINSWTTNAVTDMQTMFARAGAFNQPLDRWGTGNVNNMGNMFFAAESFDQQVDRWVTTKVTDMTYMFNRAATFNQCLSTWAYKNPTTLTGPLMFNGTKCPYQGAPNAIAGPWCQGEYHQCYANSDWESMALSSGNSWTTGGMAAALLLGGGTLFL